MNIYDLELQLSDALRLLDLALDHGHSLNRHGCDCRKGDVMMLRECSTTHAEGPCEEIATHEVREHSERMYARYWQCAKHAALTVATQDGIVATDLETGEVTSSIARSPHVTRHVFANGTTFAACDDHLDMVPGDKLSKSELPYRTVDRCDECEHRATWAVSR